MVSPRDFSAGKENLSPGPTPPRLRGALARILGACSGFVQALIAPAFALPDNS